MKNKLNTYGLFTDQGCLSAETIIKYTTNRLSEDEILRVQKHVATCNLCNEAVQGAKNFADIERYWKGIDVLRDRWHGRKVKERTISRATLAAVISVAASIALIICIHFAAQYQKKIRQQQLASVYRQGTSIEVALKKDNLLFTQISENESSVTQKYDVAIREKFKEMIPNLKEENLPLALLDETRIVAGTENTSTKESRDKTTETSEQKPAVLRYPYRVMSMPPPENIDGDEASSSEGMFFIVEEIPQFQGKDLKQFSNYVKRNLHYPAKAVDKHISGRVYVQFTINETGSLTDATVLKSVHPILDKEVLRVIKNSPVWQPGKQRGRPVKVSMVMPVDFVLY